MYVCNSCIPAACNTLSAPSLRQDPFRFCLDLSPVTCCEEPCMQPLGYILHQRHEEPCIFPQEDQRLYYHTIKCLQENRICSLLPQAFPQTSPNLPRLPNIPSDFRPVVVWPIQRLSHLIEDFQPLYCLLTYSPIRLKFISLHPLAIAISIWLKPISMFLKKWSVCWYLIRLPDGIWIPHMSQRGIGSYPSWNNVIFDQKCRYMKCYPSLLALCTTAENTGTGQFTVLRTRGRTPHMWLDLPLRGTLNQNEWKGKW